MHLCDFPHKPFVEGAWNLDGAHQHGDGDVPAGALELLGWQIRLLCARPSSETGPSAATAHALQSRRRWLIRVESAAEPGKKVCMRLAAVASLRASGILAVDLEPPSSEITSGNTDQILDAWFLGLGLLLDDDEDVRDAAAEALRVCLAQLSGSRGSASASGVITRMCNAKTLEVSMDTLTDAVCTADTGNGSVVRAYATRLLQFLPEVSASVVQGAATMASEDEKKPNGNRLIFEPEEVNMFLEPVLVAQLVARQFSRLIARRNATFTETLKRSVSAPFSTALESSLRVVLSDLKAGVPMLSGTTSTGGESAQTFRAAFVAAAGLTAGAVPSELAEEVMRAIRAEDYFTAVHPLLHSVVAPERATNGYFFLSCAPCSAELTAHKNPIGSSAMST